MDEAVVKLDEIVDSVLEYLFQEMQILNSLENYLNKIIDLSNSTDKSLQRAMKQYENECGSLLLNLKTIDRVLGHLTIELTRNIYPALAEERRREILEFRAFIETCSNKINKVTKELESLFSLPRKDWRKIESKIHELVGNSKTPSVKGLIDILRRLKKLETSLEEADTVSSDKDLLKELKKLGIETDVNRLDKEDLLIEASKNGYFGLAKALLRLDVNVNCQDEYNKTPVIWASEKGHLPIVKLFVDDYGADIHVGSEEAFLRSSRSGHLQIVEFLYSKGIDLGEISPALNVAIQYNHYPVIRFLIKVSPHQNTTIRALDLTIPYGDFVIIDLLFKKLEEELEKSDLSEFRKSRIYDRLLRRAQRHKRKKVIEYIQQIMAAREYV